MSFSPEARKRGAQRGKATQRRQYLAFLAQLIRAEVGMEASADLVLACERMYKRGYSTGYRAGHNRWARVFQGARR